MASFLLSQLLIGNVEVSLQDGDENSGGIIAVSKIDGAVRIELSNYSGAIYLKAKEHDSNKHAALSMEVSSQQNEDDESKVLAVKEEGLMKDAGATPQQQNIPNQSSLVPETVFQENQQTPRSNYNGTTEAIMSEMPNPYSPLQGSTRFDDDFPGLEMDESSSKPFPLSSKSRFDDSENSTPVTFDQQSSYGMEFASEEDVSPSGRRNRRRQGILGSSLHDKCRKPNVTLDELRESLAEEPLAASEPDVTGRLPLHILGENEALLSTRHGREDATSFCLELMDAHPDGVITADNFGRFPFTNMILEWVFVATERLGLDDQDNETMTTFINLFRRHRKEKSNPFESIMSQFSIQTPTTIDHCDTTSSRSGLVDVIVGPVLEWTFVMLSTSFDHCCGKFTRGGGGVRKRARAVGADLAKHVAAIPLLFRTMLLIEDEEVRSRLLTLSIIRRTALRSESIGPWLVSMLRKQGLGSRRVVDHFELVSSIDVTDLIGSYVTPRSNDYALLSDERDETYAAVECLGHIVPSLIVLSDVEVERAAGTDIVWRMVANASSRPFSIGVVLIDLVSHITLIMAIRVMVFWVPGPATYVDSSDFDIAFPNIIVIVISIQFILRKIGEAVSLASISQRVLMSSVISFWNVLDLAAIGSALSLALLHSLRVYQYPTLQFFAIALQWLKLLAFLRGINAELATFILSVIQIGFNIRWFMVILLIVIITFGDLMHFIALKSDAGTVCTGLNDLAVTDFCTSFLRSYLRMWTVLLGDFNMHTYQEHPAFEGLWLLFTVIGFIVLLNVLIAVVSDSYEKSRISSTRLYGRTRVDFAVSHLALEDALTLKAETFPGFDRQMFRLFRVALLLSLLLTAVLTLVYLIRLVLGEVLVFGIGGAIMGAISAAILCIALSIFTQAILGEKFDNSIGTLPIIAPCWKLFSAFCRAAVRFVSVIVLGIDSKSNAAGKAEDQWDGKLNFLIHNLETAVATSERNVTSTVKAVEKHLKYHESRLANELKDEIAEKCS